MTPPNLIVEQPGLLSTLQDLGRFGYQRFGISASGAMDGVALRAANVLTGNPPDAGAIELTLLGLTVVVEGSSCRVALAGAEMPIAVNGVPVEGWRTLELAPGERLTIGAARTGMYAYLAVAGGFDLTPTLGSLSTHSRSGIGGYQGRPLAAGDRLPLHGAGAGPMLVLPEGARPSFAGDVRVVLGPQDDAFTPEGIATFLGSEYLVTNQTDRMGARLDGPAIAHSAGFNIVSDGIMNGSIQVPGAGRPLILLADRQTTGGYPKIATVIGPDLPRVAQRRPGEGIRFVAVNPAEAEAAAHEHRQMLTKMLAAVEPQTTGRTSLTTETLLSSNLVSGVWSAFN